MCDVDQRHFIWQLKPRGVEPGGGSGEGGFFVYRGGFGEIGPGARDYGRDDFSQSGNACPQCLRSRFRRSECEQQRSRGDSGDQFLHDRQWNDVLGKCSRVGRSVRGFGSNSFRSDSQRIESCGC